MHGPHRQTWIVAATALALACGESAQKENAADARDVSLAPAESVAALNDQPPPATAKPKQQPPAGRRLPTGNQPTGGTAQETKPAAPATLPSGTVIELAARDTITSRRNKTGDSVTATLSAAIKDAQGRVVIPAGATFLGTIAEIKAAGSPGGEGTLRLAFDRVSFGGKTYNAVASSDSLQTETQGRGVTAGDAAKVGAGAAVGAVAGRLLGKNAKGAVIGGVVGAAAGAGVAAATKDQDIVLPAGGRIRLVLQQEMVLTPIG